MKAKSEWMHPREYVRNNIEYRISTANAISSFKRDQVFIMGEISYNPHHVFSDTAKEIMLLKYDVWYDYINEVEQYILCSDGSISEMIHEVMLMSDARIDYYEEILRDNFTEQFQVEYIAQWTEYHNYIYNKLKKSVTSLKNADITKSQLFSKIVRMITKAMNHTLYELQELDVLRFSNDSPSFNVDDTCIDIMQENKDAFLDRVYRFLEVRSFSNIIIKQQTDSSLTSICRRSIDILAERGISSVII